MCARSSHRRHRAGLGLLGIGIFFAGFSVPKDPGSSVRTSGPKLTVAYNFKWPLVDRQTSTAKFHDFALLCIFFKDLTVVNGWWAYTQFFTPPFDVVHGDAPLLPARGLFVCLFVSYSFRVGHSTDMCSLLQENPLGKRKRVYRGHMYTYVERR